MICQVLIIIWVTLLSIFLGLLSIYYLFMEKTAAKPWKLNTNSSYRPSVAILVPTYNEGDLIELKLANLSHLEYPKNLTQVILIDSASTDDTVLKTKEFARLHPEINLTILEEKSRSGKAKALNIALKHSKGEVIIVSDADCFWPSDILDKALPYLADPTVGAIAGQEKLLNPNQSWITATEAFYRDKMFFIQLGESKTHSTIQFEGGFGAYKREILDEFDYETGADDSGTALRIVQNGSRAIIIPEAVFFTFFPISWKGKIAIKTRRANHLLSVLFRCFRLFIEGRLLLPKKILLSETFLLLLNPLIFWSFSIVTLFLVLYYPFLVFLIMLPMMIPKTRTYLFEIVQNNLIIVSALFSILVKRKFIVWNVPKDYRTIIDIKLLRSNGLV